MIMRLFRSGSAKGFMPGFLALSFACLGFGPELTASEARPLQVTVDLHDVRVPSFLGLGIQWDPYSYPPQSEAWKLTLKRLDYARPAFFRVMLGARDYCLGFDSTNRDLPRYVWSQGEPAIRKRLGSLLDILDYAQSRNVEVLLGEWAWPGRLGNGTNGIIRRPDDPRWARLIADFVNWLRVQRGYSVIRMYNMMNEPNGGWMWPGGKVDYEAWALGVRHLRKEFDALGLHLLLQRAQHGGGFVVFLGALVEPCLQQADRRRVVRLEIARHRRLRRHRHQQVV